MSKAHARSRHFRAGVLWALATAAIGQIALGTLIDVGLPEVRDPEYAHREHLLIEQTRQRDGRPLVVVLGSSRVQNGFDAEAAMTATNQQARMFNFGIPTSGPYLERVWLDRLLAKGMKPDLLLIEVLPMHYNARRSPPDLRGLDGARLSVGEMAKMPKTVESVMGPCRRWLVGRVIPSHRHQAELRERLGIDADAPRLPRHDASQMIDAFGFQPRTFPPEQAARLRRLSHVQYDSCYSEFELSVPQAKQLHASLELCRANGIRPAILLAPEGSEFRELVTPAMEQATQRMLTECRERYGAVVIDARAWMLDPEFFDMHHLTPWGARLFSERLAREAIVPMLSGFANAAKSNTLNQE